MKSANTLKHDVKIGAATPFLFLLGLGLLLVIPQLAAAQFGVTFSVSSSEVQGTCTLNGGAQQNINVVDPASANTNGENNDRVLVASDTACGVNFFTSGPSNVFVLANDTSTSDDAEARDHATGSIFFGGLVAYGSDETHHKCVANTSTSGSCSEQATFTNLKIAGSIVPPGTFNGSQAFNISGVQMPAAGCNTMATYNGNVTLGELDPPPGPFTNQTEFYAVRIRVTETCPSPNFAIQWDVQSNGGVVSSPIGFTGVGASPQLIFQ